MNVDTTQKRILFRRRRVHAKDPSIQQQMDTKETLVLSLSTTSSSLPTPPSADNEKEEEEEYPHTLPVEYVDRLPVLKGQHTASASL